MRKIFILSPDIAHTQTHAYVFSILVVTQFVEQTNMGGALTSQQQYKKRLFCCLCIVCFLEAIHVFVVIYCTCVCVFCNSTREKHGRMELDWNIAVCAMMQSKSNSIGIFSHQHTHTHRHWYTRNFPCCSLVVYVYIDVKLVVFVIRN